MGCKGPGSFLRTVGLTGRAGHAEEHGGSFTAKGLCSRTLDSVRERRFLFVR